LNEAIKNFREVAAAYPGSARLQDEFGELLARASKYSEALAQFDKAVAVDPSDEAPRRNRALVLRQIAGR